MNCTINSASNFSGLQAGISQISPAQLAAPVRKSTLNRPFISPILGIDWNSAPESDENRIGTDKSEAIIFLSNELGILKRISGTSMDDTGVDAFDPDDLEGGYPIL